MKVPEESEKNAEARLRRIDHTPRQAREIHDQDENSTLSYMTVKEYHNPH